MSHADDDAGLRGYGFNERQIWYYILYARTRTHTHICMYEFKHARTHTLSRTNVTTQSETRFTHACVRDCIFAFAGLRYRARHVSRTRACVTAHLCLRSTRTHIPTRAVLIFMRGVCVCHSMCVLSSTCAKTGREGERERGGGGVSFTGTLRSACPN